MFPRLRAILRGMEDSFEALIGRIAGWARSRPDVRAAVVIGSRARTDRPADEWSDLDVLLYVVDPGRYLCDAGWLADFGRPLLTFTEGTAGGSATRERRALFEGGLDVDFALVPVRLARSMARWLRLQKRAPFLLRFLPAAARVRGEVEVFAGVQRRGVRVLVDKDGFGRMFPLLEGKAPAPALPSREEFLNAVNDFWYHAVWTAKKLRRGELWTAKGCCDGYMKGILLRMAAWHARATRGAGTDTWHQGRFFEQWADPRAVSGLRQAHAHYDEADVWRALAATMDLFRWLSLEAARKLEVEYPASGADRAAGLVKRLFEERG